MLGIMVRLLDRFGLLPDATWSDHLVRQTRTSVTLRRSVSLAG
jgi:hypothetical protein